MALRDFILYPLAGAVVGVLLAAAITRAPVPVPGFDAATGLFLVAAAVVGGAAYVAWKRRGAAPRAKAPAPERPAPTVTIAPAKPAPSGPGPAGVRLRFPQIAAGYPDVWGVGDALEAVVDAPAEATVAVAAAGKSLGSALATGSPVLFPVKVSEPGELEIEATVTLRGAKATARRAIRFVRYDEEIQTLYATFRDWAVETWPETKNALTARELIQMLRGRLGPEAGEALLGATRVFELVAYGGRVGERALYLTVVDALAAVAAAAEGAPVAEGARGA